MTPKERAEAAQLLGMKSTEIVDVTEIDGGVLITTHDGVRTKVDTETGAMTFFARNEVVTVVAAAPAAEPDAETPAGSGNGDEPVVGVKRKMSEVLAWVEADPERVAERAKAALEAEFAGPDSERRASLITKLETLAGA